MWDNNPPLYYYLLWLWVKIVGVTEFKVRLLSVIISALSVTAFYILVKKYFSQFVAFFTSALFTLHNLIFYQAQEARSYSLNVLLVIISVWLFFKLLETPNMKNTLFLSVINFLMIDSHYLTGIVVLMQFLFVLLNSRKELKYVIFSNLILLGLIAILFSRYQFNNLLNFGNSEHKFWVELSTLQGLLSTLQSLFGQHSLYYISFLIFLVSVFYQVFNKKQIDDAQKPFLLFANSIVLFSISVLFLIGFVKPLFLDRYIIYIIPFYLLSITWFVERMGKSKDIFIILLTGIQVAFLNIKPSKNMDYRFASEIIKNLNDDPEKALIIIQPGDLSENFLYYYSPSDYKDYWHLDSNYKKLNIHPIYTEADLMSIDLVKYNRVIMCQSFESSYDQNKDVKKLNRIFKKHVKYTQVKSVIIHYFSK